MLSKLHNTLALLYLNHIILASRCAKLALTLLSHGERIRSVWGWDLWRYLKHPSPLSNEEKQRSKTRDDYEMGKGLLAPLFRPKSHANDQVTNMGRLNMIYQREW